MNETRSTQQPSMSHSKDDSTNEMRLAKSSVFVSSTSTQDVSPSSVLLSVPAGNKENSDRALRPHEELCTDSTGKNHFISSTNEVRGPCLFSSAEKVLANFHAIGFQASHFGSAVKVARKALHLQPRSTQYAVKDGQFVEVREGNQDNRIPIEESDSKDRFCAARENENRGKNRSQKGEEKEALLVRPLIFLGMTAQLMGTGCREAVVFLLKEGLEARHITSSQQTQNGSSVFPLHFSDPLKSEEEKTVAQQEKLEEKSSITISDGQQFGEFLLKKVGIRDVREEDDEKEKSRKNSCNQKKQGHATAHQCVLQKDSISLPFYSFLSCLVVSGGGMEHDIRRSCTPYPLRVYSSEEEVRVGGCSSAPPFHPHRKKSFNTGSSTEKFSFESENNNEWNEKYVHFGNITYSRDQLAGRARLSRCSLPFFRAHCQGDVRKATLFASEEQEGTLLSPGSTGAENRNEEKSCASSTVEEKDETLWTLMDMVMSVAVRRLLERQVYLQDSAAREPIPADSYFDTCPWYLTPSEMWAWIGWNLPGLFMEALARIALKWGPFDHPACRSPTSSSCHPTMDVGEKRASSPISTTEKKMWEKLMQDPNIQQEAQDRAETTAVYWAARQSVPIFCPSFADGDIMDYIRLATYSFHSTSTSPISSSRTGVAPTLSLAVDLVRDIHYLNYLAMSAGRTAAIICGGGVVKHHICNANLMRNGADYSIFLNNGQEFDGSDGGAQPEEALSWGKLRFDGQHVKVYGEVTTVFPLLVGEVFLPAVRNKATSL